jgi:hypothetical protein
MICEWVIPFYFSGYGRQAGRTVDIPLVDGMGHKPLSRHNRSVRAAARRAKKANTMKVKLLHLLPVIFVTAAGWMSADTKRVMVVQQILTDDTNAYVKLLGEANVAVKARTGVADLRHAWVGEMAGQDSHALFVVSEYESAAAVAALDAKLDGDANIEAILARFAKIRKLGWSALFKAVRYEGLYEHGAAFITDINCSDEDAYVKALDGLKSIIEANGFKDAKLSLWRVASGRTNASHTVIIAFPSFARELEFIDVVHNKDVLKEWNVGAAKIRTTVSNGSYTEVTK